MILPHRFSAALGSVVERMAKLSPPRHRDLVRGMVAELDSIADSGERTRFALGAIAAIARLVLTGYSRAPFPAQNGMVVVAELEDDADPGGPWMSKLTTRHLLRRHAIPFAVLLTVLTGLLVANFAVQRVPGLSTQGAPLGTIVEVLLLAVPHTLALTLPMAVFFTVLWVFTRLGAEGVLDSAEREHHGLRRMVIPVLYAATVIAGLAFVSNSQVLPRANARMVTVLVGAPGQPTDRSMTLGQLREAARQARTDPGVDAVARALAYEVEFHKKFALAAACLFLALAGVAIAIRFPRGGQGLVVGAGILVFTGYYLSLVAGESLADQGVISPLVAMWTANAFLLAVAFLLGRRPSQHGPASGVETLAIDG